MNKKVSIIVPVYNVEKYLAKCLDSLVCQSYDNFDVIVVNDGSPFNEQAIIDEYAQKYPCIKPIQKENGGYGSVLQLAISLSDADYILVCDSDDYLDKDAVKTLMEYRDKEDADLVVGAKYLVYEDSDDKDYDASYNSEFGNLEDGKLYKKTSKDFEMLYFMEPSPHAKLYRKDIVKNIVFPHKVSYTDNLLYFYTLSRVHKVTYCQKALSYYLINRSGNTRTDLKPTIIDSWVKAFNAIMDQSENCEDIFYYRMFEAFYSIYYKVDYIKADEELKKEKYDLIYSYLERLIPYKEVILQKNKGYQEDNSVILKQKEALLTFDKSRNQFDALVQRRLHGSFKDKVKSKVLESNVLSKAYEIYHFYAKYYKTRNDEKIVLGKDVSIKNIHEEGTNFFGYYDKPCIRNGHALYQHLDSKFFDYGEPALIYVDDKEVSLTHAWNCQQGSMASWMDDDTIIHNDYDGTKYISRIVNIHTLETKIIDFPIYTLSKDNTFALSLNFSRLAKLRRDYGYFCLPYNNLKDNSEDGIYYVDLEKNTHELYLSLEDIIAYKTKENMKGAIHKVNHIDISPDSKKALFLHRWFVGKTKYTRLLCLEIATKKLTLLADNDMVSHMCWVNNEKVFGYLRGKNGKDGCFFIDMEGNQEQLVHPFLVDDGHPSVYNEDYIVIDSYPDYTCKSKLMLINTKTKTVTIIGRFYSGIAYQNEFRCDLHPRFNSSGKRLTIDSVASGRKNVYEINLEKLI